MRVRTTILWVILIGCVGLAAFQSRHLAAVRRAGMSEAYSGYSADTPPVLTFVMAGLGGFRGIVSEILWFRAGRLQEEGRFLELVQLADWLTLLDPRAAEAWIYNAWNLAYNISVMMIRPEDRLRWVRNGISLLRDDGLRMNPKEARLYRELAWFYMNKIGSNLDEAHETYKKALADQMAPCVGPGGAVSLTDDSRRRLGAMRLDADQMAALERRFGPLDWRLAESHAIYWAWRGLQFAKDTEALMCRRLIYQSLILMIFRLPPGAPPSASGLALVPATTVFIEETLEKFPSRHLSAFYFRYLARIAALARDSGDETLARDCHARFIAHLPPGTDVPSLDDIIRDAQNASPP